MGKTLILAIDELAQSQVQAFQTVNDAISALENSTNKLVSISDTGVYEVSEILFTRNFVFKAVAAMTEFVTPITINGNVTNRVFVFMNAHGSAITVKADGTGSTVSVPAGKSRLLLAFDDDIFELAAQS